MTKEARSLYYKTLWIRYLREMDRHCSKLVDLAWTNRLTFTNKHTSLLRRFRICNVLMVHAQDCLYNKTTESCFTQIGSVLATI